MTQPFFPCTISAQSRSNEFLTMKTVVRKTYQHGVFVLRQGHACARGGGYMSGMGDVQASHRSRISSACTAPLAS